MKAKSKDNWIGECKLCLKRKELLDSHYLGAALYKIAKKRGGSLVRTPELFLESDIQIHHHLFCGNCEQLFNKYGERYVITMMNRGEGDFPLLKIMDESTPIAFDPNNVPVFSSLEIGVDTVKLAYYALSMFWRGSVHSWKTLGGQTTSVYLNPGDQEAIRRFLIGEIRWPPGIVVQVAACTDTISQDNVLAPANFRNKLGCSMVMYGILFDIFCGVQSGSSDWNLCCVNSPARVIFRHTNEEETREQLDDLERAGGHGLRVQSPPQLGCPRACTERSRKPALSLPKGIPRFWGPGRE